MTTPTIPDLPSATTINDSDQLLIRQPAGALGQDKKCTAQQIRNLNLAGLSATPITPQTSDLMLIAQGGLNYQIRYDQVSHIQGTRMWFYQNSAPSGWTTVTSGDTLLAVKGGLTYTLGGTEQGDWQQVDHALTIAEIPAHTHTINTTNSSNNPLPSRLRQGNTTTAVSQTGSAGGGQGHNHGNAWRPRSAVGLICSKD